MDIRHALHFSEAETLGTDALRQRFLVETLFEPGRVHACYSHYERLTVAGIVPATKSLSFPEELKAVSGSDYFLERREAGIVHIGGEAAHLSVDGIDYVLEREDVLYIGMGARDVRFASANPAVPARLYLVSAPAHASVPHKKASRANISFQTLGSAENANRRTIGKYIHGDGLPSCQLVLGITSFEPGNVWNTMPAHLHDRRSEVYLYFGMAKDGAVFHFMGRPQATRHLVVRNEQAVLSPPWSIHAGCGTGSYAFVWAMAGDNCSFADMDGVAMGELK